MKLDKFKLNSKLIIKEIVEHSPSVGIIPVIDYTHVPFCNPVPICSKETDVRNTCRENRGKRDPSTSELLERCTKKLATQAS